MSSPCSSDAPNGACIQIVVEEPSSDEDDEKEWIPVDSSYQRKSLRRGSHIEALCPKDRNEARVLVLCTGGTICMQRKSEGVYKPIPHMLEEAIRKFPSLHDDAYANEHFSDQHPPPLVLPETHNYRRIVYTVYEYNPLLDSSNVTIDDWVSISRDIQKYYESVDGFVILHGTDTMAYTASALSFMLENLGKPVVLTGSQIPLFETRSDGQSNLLGALLIAGNFSIPEVTLFFNQKLFRGNRTSKVSAGDFSAFNSPNMSPLVTFGININVDWKSVYRPTNIERFSIHSTLNRNVGLLRLFPSITTETVAAFLKPPMQGVVLQTYGNGNAPSDRKDLLQQLKEATDRGVIILNITQCSRGSVTMAYETGKCLADAGVLPGLDMTSEAALTKLSYILGKDLPLSAKQKLVMSNIRGEMTIFSPQKAEDLDIVTTIACSLKLATSEESAHLKKVLFPSIVCAAAGAGDIDKLELLSQHGADCTTSNYDQRTPLHIATSNGQKEVVEYLLRHGASVHARDRNGRTPLTEAVAGNHDSIIQLLRRAGAYLVEELQVIGEELCSAAARDNVKKLCSYSIAGANLDQPDPCGRTALQLAVLNKSVNSVHFLLERGADKNRKDLLGNTAISIASQLESSAKILNLLNKSECKHSSDKG